MLREMGEALEALAADVLLSWTIERVADCHVVGRDGFGHGAGRAAHVEEPAGDFLPGAYLGERAVRHRIAVQRQRFLLRARSRFIHKERMLAYTLPGRFPAPSEMQCSDDSNR